MIPAERVIAELRRRGDIWEAAPGLTGLRGCTLALFEAIRGRIAALAREVTGDEIRVPPALGFDVLERAAYFDSFPHWLTAAAHLTGDEKTLEMVARDPRPGELAARSLVPSRTALSPALCYHVYDLHAHRTLAAGPTTMCTQGTCWRREERFDPLERAWAFTMVEVVCLGSSDEVASFRTEWIHKARALAEALGLEPRVEPATDPFFAPTARGRQLIQKLKSLKDELLLPIGDSKRVAAASFNHHESFFGSAFDIELASGECAASGCVAFGLERWLLAFLVAHGPDPEGWPPVEVAEAAAGAIS
jgi:seryl-tRNA synthetase